jgi:hypothetical protein
MERLREEAVGFPAYRQAGKALEQGPLPRENNPPMNGWTCFQTKDGI